MKKIMDDDVVCALLLLISRTDRKNPHLEIAWEAFDGVLDWLGLPADEGDSQCPWYENPDPFHRDWWYQKLEKINTKREMLSFFKQTREWVDDFRNC